ncbi:MAG: choice-of-anchor Q domain-containing protein, partial [Candidatus Delongbacteria bacterium]
EVWKGSANPKYESAAWNIFDGTIDDNDVLYSVEEDPDSVDFTPVAEGWEVDWDGIAPAPIVYFGEVVICDKLIFNETSVNSGEIDNTSSALIKHNNFKGACFSGVDNEDFYANSKIQLTNIPSGLTPSIIRIDSVTLNFTFNGTASSHENADDAVMTLSYSNSAFTSGDVSAIKNNTSDIILNFCQEYSVAPSGGDFTTISGAVNAEGYIYGIGDVINVAAGTYIETSELLIEKGITIQGAGFENTIVQVNEPGVSQYKLFNILKDWERDDDFEVVIKGLTIKGGDISTLGYNSEAYGGSIYAGEVGLYLYNAVVENSRAWSGGGIYTEGANVLLENVTVRNNSSVWDGGGVYLNYTDENCVAKVINSTIYGNNTDASGGGIVARDSTEITNSTIIDNVASDDAGGIRCESSSKVLITNSTVLGNSAGDEGGGFWTNFGEITISNTIITDNYANSANSDYHREYGSYLTDNGYNCIGYQISVGTDNFTHPENILFNLKADSTASAEWTRNNIALTNQTVGLDTLLADNDTNNNTQTIALLDGSFLIDAGNDQANGTVDIPAQDQRGFNRNGNVDIGAYEFMSLYYPQNVLTAINGDDFELSWSPVVGATGYKVYSSDDPYSGFVEEAIAPTGETWSIEASESKKFYYVVAVDGAKVSTKKIKAKDSNSESR